VVTAAGAVATAVLAAGVFAVGLVAGAWATASAVIHTIDTATGTRTGRMKSPLKMKCRSAVNYANRTH
jgi:hypothetical protein